MRGSTKARLRVGSMLAALLVALSACDDEQEGRAAGEELGPCADGFCQAPLVCAPEDVCVDPAQLGGDTDSSTTTSSTTTGMPDGDEGTHGGENERTGGGESDGPQSTSGNDSEGDTTGGADTGGSDDIPQACVQYANAYCSCIAEVASPDCIANVRDDCAWVYDSCPSLWTCINNHTSACDLDAAADCTCD